MQTYSNQCGQMHKVNVAQFNKMAQTLLKLLWLWVNQVVNSESKAPVTLKITQV